MLHIMLLSGFIAFQGAEVHTVDGPPIQDATILVYGEKIINVGKTGSFQIPKSAEVVDISGKVVTPGLIHAYSQLGLVEVDMEGGDEGLHVDAGERKDTRAAYRVTDGINPHSTLIPIARSEGVTSALVAPSGGLLSGRATFIDLIGDTVDTMVVRDFAGIAADVRGGAETVGGRGGAWMRLREVLYDARLFASSRRRRAWESNQLRDLGAHRLDLEALGPIVRKQRPLLIRVDRASDILLALELSNEYKVDIVLVGASEGWMVADKIAAAKVPVIVEYPKNLPGDFNAPAARNDNPARLVGAGVKIALVPGAWAANSHQVGRLRQEAANAVVDGLTREEALTAITRAPAEIFSLTRGTGTVTANAPATFVVWSGDPFLVSSEAERVFIRGEELPLDDRQHELFHRYESFPASGATAGTNAH